MGNDSALTETPLQVKTTLRSLTEIAMLMERLPPLGSVHCNRPASILRKTCLTIVCFV
jgi:hypothetical protein